MRPLIFLLAWILACPLPPVFSKEVPAGEKKQSSAAPNVFAKQFFLSPGQRVDQQVYLIDGFAFLESPDRTRNSRYSLITDFGKTMVRSRAIPGLQSVPDIKQWLKDHAETSEYEGVEIRKLAWSAEDQGQQTFYWVGQKGFVSLERAKQEIAQVKSVIEAQGGELEDSVRAAQEMFRPSEEEAAAEIEYKANFQKEEELAVKMIEKMEFGDKLFGPFEGQTTGEPIIWRSFGETSWRKTIFESETYSAAVGYWTNQLVFQGLKFPLNTINPYIELTGSMDSSPIDYKSNLIGYVGAEWRPFARNPFFENYQPYGIPLLKWVRNYRLYVQYGNRWNIKNEIENSRNYDLQSGVSIFYEYGIDLPPIDQGSPVNVPEYLREYVWGEYYGNYYYSNTGFAAEDDWKAWTFNSSVIFGLKTPPVHLPDNVFFDQIVLMPYMRFEHVNNSEFSFPYTNRYFVAAGLRWMPFRTYRHKNNEWLSKIKVYGEYMGIGDAQYTKQDGEAPHAITHDLMFGVKFSSNRY